MGYADDLCVPLSLPVPLVTAVHAGEPAVLQSLDETQQAGYERTPTSYSPALTSYSPALGRGPLYL